MARQELIDIADIIFAENNPKLHDLGALAQSLARYGFVEIPVVNERTGRLVAGQGRIEALRALHAEGKPIPPGVVERGGRWFVDVRIHAFASDAEAQAYLLDSNSLVLSGGDFTAVDIAKLWNEDAYKVVLRDLAENSSLPVSVDGDDLDMLLHVPDPNFEHKRPTFDALIDDMTAAHGKPQIGPRGDGNWFYAEYYGQNERYAELCALLAPYFKGASKKEIDPDFFERAIRAAVGEGNDPSA